MVEQLDGGQMRGRGGVGETSSVNWDALMTGKPMLVRRGEDFTCTTASFRTQCSAKAKRMQAAHDKYFGPDSGWSIVARTSEYHPITGNKLPDGELAVQFVESEPDGTEHAPTRNDGFYYHNHERDPALFERKAQLSATKMERVRAAANRKQREIYLRDGVPLPSHLHEAGDPDELFEQRQPAEPEQQQQPAVTGNAAQRARFEAILNAPRPQMAAPPVLPPPLVPGATMPAPIPVVPQSQPPVKVEWGQVPDLPPREPAGISIPLEPDPLHTEDFYNGDDDVDAADWPGAVAPGATDAPAPSPPWQFSRNDDDAADFGG